MVSLQTFTGFRFNNNVYPNFLGWAQDGDHNLFTITGPSANTTTGVNQSEGTLWENNLSIVNTAASKIYVCTILPDGGYTNAVASGSNIGNKWFTVSGNNDWDSGTMLQFTIVNGSTPKGSNFF